VEGIGGGPSAQFHDLDNVLSFQFEIVASSG